MKCGDCKYFELLEPKSKTSWGRCIWAKENIPIHMPYWAQTIGLMTPALHPSTGDLKENFCSCYEERENERDE